MTRDQSGEDHSPRGPRLPWTVAVVGAAAIAGALLLTYLALGSGVGVNDEPDTPAQAQCVRVVADVLDAELSGRRPGAVQDAIRRWGKDSDASSVISQVYVGLGGRRFGVARPPRHVIETETRKACRLQL